jgi:hypothetical protein
MSGNQNRSRDQKLRRLAVKSFLRGIATGKRPGAKKSISFQ